MLDPTRHANSADAAARYKTEPYVIAGDVYSTAPHAGRGGWSWYTGAAGWMVQFILESLLGLKVEADALRVNPCVPASWSSFQVHYRYRQTPYHIRVRQTAGADHAPHLSLDGVVLSGATIPLLDDRREHRVDVEIRATVLAGI